MKRHLITFAITIASCSAFSQSAQPTAEIKSVREGIVAAYPDTTITSVTTTPIPGLYEVLMGRNIAYTDKAGRYLVFGHMIDGKERVNLTEKRLAAAQRGEVASLPAGKAIKVTRGTGERSLYIFTDPDCPFCRQIEPELDKLKDVTIYYMLMPLSDITAEKVTSVWCAKDRVGAWKLAISGKPVPSARCQAPIEEFRMAAKRFGIQGTPSMISADGRVLSGYTSAEDIEIFIRQAENLAKK
jgi:thiol:disulfide interchange protein DsbC